MSKLENTNYPPPDLQDHVHLAEAGQPLVPHGGKQLLDVGVSHELDTEIINTNMSAYNGPVCYHPLKLNIYKIQEKIFLPSKDQDQLNHGKLKLAHKCKVLVGYYLVIRMIVPI